MVLAEDLRQAVIQQAIQGKLTKQLDTDGNVDILLKEIEQEKTKFMVENKRKPEPKLAAYDESDIPFEIPANWRWCQLGDIISYQNGYAFRSSDMSKGVNGYPVIKSQNLMTLKVVIKDGNDRIEFPDEKMLLCQIRKNDLLMCLSSQSSNPEPLGKTAIYESDEPALLNQRVLKITLMKMDMLYYIFYVINSAYFHYDVSHKGDGSAQSNLKLEHVREMLIPIPPIEEQQRIVDKINEIMPKIEEYEKIEKELEALKKEFPNNMKDALLQAAMQGKLTKQLESDSSVDELLLCIEEDRKNKINSGVTKRDKRLFISYVDDEDAPYIIPDTWRMVTLGSIVYKLTDGTHKTPKYAIEGVKFVSVKDMSSGKLDFSNTKFITQEEHNELYKRCNPEKGDMLLSKVGTTGVPAIIDTDEQFSLFVSVALLKYNHQFINEKFLYYLLMSPLVQEQVRENTRGVGNKNWVLDFIAKTVIVLPSIEEQQRIVERLDALLPLCEDLKE